MKLILVFLGFIVGFVGFAYGEQGNVEQIKNIYAKVNDIIKSNNVERLSLYNEAADIDNNTQWETVIDARSRDIYNISIATAMVFIYNNKIIKTTMNIRSDSGDWKYYVEYVFHNNGNTAFIFEKLITYQGFDYDSGVSLPKGPYILEKRYYFNENGRNIQTISKAYNQNNNKPVNINYIKQFDVSLYKSISKLPYYKLIKNKDMYID